MEDSVTLIVNKKPVSLNAFVQNVLKIIILGAIASLQTEDEKVEKIEVTIKMGG